MPLDKTPDDYLEMTEDELKRRKEAFEAYKLQQEVQETLKWKWITKLGSSLGVVTIVIGSSRAWSLAEFAQKLWKVGT